MRIAAAHLSVRSSFVVGHAPGQCGMAYGKPRRRRGEPERAPVSDNRAIFDEWRIVDGPRPKASTSLAHQVRLPRSRGTREKGLRRRATIDRLRRRLLAQVRNQLAFAIGPATRACIYRSSPLLCAGPRRASASGSARSRLRLTNFSST